MSEKRRVEKSRGLCSREIVSIQVKKDQTPKRFPNVSEELAQLVKKGLEIGVCSTCSGARGITQEEIIDGAHIGSLTTELAGYLGKSDRVITLRR